MSAYEDIRKYVDTLTLSECLKWIQALSTMEHWVSGGEYEKEIMASQCDEPIRELLSFCIYGWIYKRTWADYEKHIKEAVGDKVPQSAIIKAFEHDFPALWYTYKEEVLNIHNWCV